MAEAMVMSKEHRKILLQNRSILETDLQAVQLLKYLTDTLSQEDDETVKAERTRTEQARVLLDILPRKGPTAFVAFVNALWKVQKHLAHILSQAACLEEPSDIDENEKIAVSGELRAKLRNPALRNYLKEIDFNRLIKLMKIALTKEDMESIKSKTTTDDKVDEFLSILPHKGRGTYEHFVDVAEMVDKKIVEILEGNVPSSTKGINSHADRNKKKSITVNPLNETPISHIRSYLSTFYAVTNQCNGWISLAQEYQLPQENYTGNPNPTEAILNDWIQKEGDRANVSKLRETLVKHNLQESKACLDELLSSNDCSDGPVDDVDDLTKKTGNLGFTSVPVQDTAAIIIPRTLKDLDEETLSQLRKQVIQEGAIKEISIDIFNPIFDKGLSRTIRDLTKDLRKHNLTDAINWMKTNLPAGVTGPLFDEKKYIRDLPYSVRSRLTIQLTNDHVWIRLAEKIGMDAPKIKYLKQQYKNPADEVLNFWQTRANSNVGIMYDILVGLNLPVIAELL